MVAFCCGLSCTAFLYRSSAGIFAKASEIGSELVHKLEPDNVSSDKMKNPATVADKVGAVLLDAGGGLQTPSRLILDVFSLAICALCSPGDYLPLILGANATKMRAEHYFSLQVCLM